MILIIMQVESFDREKAKEINIIYYVKNGNRNTGEARDYDISIISATKIDKNDLVYVFQVSV